MFELKNNVHESSPRKKKNSDRETFFFHQIADILIILVISNFVSILNCKEIILAIFHGENVRFNLVC